MGGVKCLAVALLATSCSSQSHPPPEGTPDGATVDAPIDDTGNASVSDAAGDVATTTSATGCDAAVGATATGDSGTSAGNATNYYLFFINNIPGACLPLSLPIDGAGQPQCQVFFTLAAGDACTAHAGLSAAAADVVASIRNTEQVPSSQAICVLAQVPATDWVCGSCAASRNTGWCYVTGPAAGKCTQVLVFSPSATPPSGATVLVGCGTTSSSSVGSSSAASVGASCVPSPELSADFAGFDYHEVTLDENNAACSGAVCLVNHFQGLTDCPYGQGSNGNPNPGSTSACTVPGTSAPVRPNDSMTGQAVDPQCLDRRASKTVYCSCRCADAEGNTNDEASYCTCPSGYACTQVVPAIQSGDPRAGAYCIQNDTAYNADNACNMECDATTGNCP